MEETPERKICASCGRSFEWQRRWRNCWDQVRYCSAACRSRRVGPRERRVEAELLRMLDARAADATLCPSEVARSLESDEWRSLMESVRRAARRLAARGQVEITQGGRAVDPSDFRGPIRIRRAARRVDEPTRVR